MQCFASTGVVSLLWAAVGYSLTFSDGGSPAIVHRRARPGVPARRPRADALYGHHSRTVLHVPDDVRDLTPALVIGGFAERMRFFSRYSVRPLWLLFVYVPLAHWVWAAGGSRSSRHGLCRRHRRARECGCLRARLCPGARASPWLSAHGHGAAQSPFTVTGAGMLWVGCFGLMRAARSPRTVPPAGDVDTTHTGRVRRRARMDVHRGRIR